MEFGSYKTVRELASSGSATVYLASGPGDKGQPQFAVKVCTAGNPGALSPWEEDSTQAAEHAAERARDFLAATTKQKRAAAGARHVAPVHDGGQSESGAWFATDFYPRSIQKLIEGRVSLPHEGVHHLLTSVARGALELKASAGETHGNLKPANILVSAAKSFAAARVVITDPAPPGSLSADAMEVADLHAIGELLYKIVRRRDVSGRDHWPISSSEEWTTLFGEAAPKWLALCNDLIDPSLKASTLSLESLLARLAELKPKGKRSLYVKMAGVAAIVVLSVIAVVTYWPASAPKEIVIVTEPPGAELSIPGYFGTFGVTPISVPSPLGTNLELQLTLEGHQSLVTNVFVVKGARKIIVAMVPTGLPDMREQRFNAAMLAATNALDTGNFVEAARQAEIARRIMTNSLEASSLYKLASDRREEHIYTNAFALASAALAADNYGAALEQVNAALVARDTHEARLVRTNAMKMLGDAESYRSLTNAATIAFNENRFEDAQKRAEEAIRIRNTPEAAQIRDRSIRNIRDMNAYGDSFAKARSALAVEDFNEALFRIGQALRVRATSAEALQVRDSALKGSNVLFSYRTTLRDATNALAGGQFAEAVQFAVRAAGLRTNNLEAVAYQQLAQAALERKQRYDRFFSDATNALARGEFALATNSAASAYALTNTAESKQVFDLATQYEKTRQQYLSAYGAATNAYANGRFSEAVKSADEALLVRANDGPALAVRKAANERLEEERKFNAALASARDAFSKGSWPAAIAAADEALKIRTGSPEATKVRADAMREQKADDDYKKSFAAADVAFKAEKFDVAITNATAALASRNRPEAQQLLSEARTLQKEKENYEAAIRDAQAALTRNDFETARTRASSVLTYTRGGTVARDIVARAEQGIDLRDARKAYDSADYAEAARICERHPAIEEFKQLLATVNTERGAYSDASSKFSQGNYTYISALESQPFGSKPAFATLIRNGRAEQQALAGISSLTNNAKNFATVRGEWGKLGDVTNKQSFRAVGDWLYLNDPVRITDVRFQSIAHLVLGYPALERILRDQKASMLVAIPENRRQKVPGNNLDGYRGPLNDLKKWYEKADEWKASPWRQALYKEAEKTINNSGFGSGF